MGLPTVIFNSAGSDTAASGAGPATALFGTGGATTAASADVDLSVDAPDLSGVATDGTAVLWIDTASGRQFGRVTAVNNGTKVVTCHGTFANTAGSKNWGIGGKRATFDHADSRTLFADLEAGWIVETETDQSLTSVIALALNVAGPTIRGNSASTRRVITQTANAACFSTTGGTSQRVTFQNLQLVNTNGTKTSAHGVTSSVGAMHVFVNTVIGHATNTINNGFNRSAGAPNTRWLNSATISCTGSGMSGTGGTAHHCWKSAFIGSASHGISAGSTDVLLVDCILTDNGGDGLNMTTGTIIGIIGCTIDGNGGDGVDLSTDSGGMAHAIIINNNFTNNASAYGVRFPTLAVQPATNFCNNYSGNATAGRLNLDAGTNDTAVDPGYANAGALDFSVGTAVKALGLPIGGSAYIGAGQTTTYSYVDIGASQRQEPTQAGAPPIGLGSAVIRAA